MLMPPYAASALGSRNTPEPIMLPTTRAVAIPSPSLRRVPPSSLECERIVDRIVEPSVSFDPNHLTVGMARRPGQGLPPCSMPPNDPERSPGGHACSGRSFSDERHAVVASPVRFRPAERGHRDREVSAAPAEQRQQVSSTKNRTGRRRGRGLSTATPPAPCGHRSVSSSACCVPGVRGRRRVSATTVG
jgi:hypothetical protein